MKSIATVILAFAICLIASSQELPDSTAVEKTLGEVTVQATPVIRKTDRDVYAISDEVKERSATPLLLLSNVGIPSLAVNDIMRKVTVDGNDVEIRINGRKASVDQLITIPIDNIRRVEFIDNPGLKYDGATAVLNVVVANPEQGGSLSITEMQAFNYGWNNPAASLTLEHGKSQFKLSGFGSIRHKLPVFRDYNDRYLMPDGSTVERTETPDDGHFTNYGVYPGIDYNYYVPEKTNIYVSAYFPMNFSTELLYLGDLATKGLPGSTRLTDRQLMPNRNQQISAYIEQSLPHDQTIMANIGWGGRTDRSRRIYSETPDSRATGNEIFIDNNIRNHSSSWSAETDYTKKWGRNILTAGLRYSGSSNKARYIYDGTPSQTIRQTSDRLYFFSEYTLQAGKWNITAGAAGTWQDNATEGKHVKNLHFTPRVSAAWRYNDISRWTFTVSSYTSAPSLSETSGVMQQIDGFQIQQGNPDLKAYATYRGSVRYGFALGDRFSGSLTATASHTNRPVQDYYTWSGDKILHTWANDGKASSLNLIFSPRWEYIPGWATLSGSVAFRRFWNEGRDFRHTLSNWYGDFDATFYHWGFDVTMSYQRAGAYLNGENIDRGEAYTQFILGYAWKDWHFSFGLFNPLGRYSQETQVISKLVTQKTIMRTTACDCMPFINVAYNISWGRQPRHTSRKLESELSGSGASAAKR